MSYVISYNISRIEHASMPFDFVVNFTPLMPVVAYSEEKLVVDAFGGNGECFECSYYCIGSDKTSFVKEDKLKYYDIGMRRLIFELGVGRLRDIKMTQSGCYVGALSDVGKLIVFGKSGIVLQQDNVAKFVISDDLLAYISKKSLFIHRIANNKVSDTPSHRCEAPVIEFFIAGNFVFLTTDKTAENEKYRVLRIDEHSTKTLHTLDVLQGFTLKAHPSGRYMLFLVVTSYIGSGYYPESDLYFHSVKDCTFKKVQCLTVNFYTFTASGFAVCHGPQPCDVFIYDFECRPIYKFPKGVRNRIFFNWHENIVVFGGFDSLPGNIEVFDVLSGELISKFNVLGASQVDWSENGSYFYVSTTNQFRENNRITKYDYYGRAVAEKRYASLESVAVYGEKEDFVELERPSDLIIEGQRQKYVPPSLREKKEASSQKTKLINRNPRKETKEKKDILNTLERIKELKDRLKVGEVLSVDEMNLILKESKFNSDLGVFEK